MNPSRPAVSALVALTLAHAPASVAGAAEPPAWLAQHESIERLSRPQRTISIGLQLPHSLSLLAPNPFSAAFTFASLQTPALQFRHPPELAAFTDSGFGLSPETFDQLIGQAERLLVDPGDRSIMSEETVASVHEAGVSFDMPTPEQLNRVRELIAGAPCFGQFMSARLAHPVSVVPVLNLTLKGEPGNGLQLGEGIVLFDISPVVGEPSDLHAEDPEVLWSRRANELLLAYARQMGHVRWDRLDDATREQFTNRFWPEGRRPRARETATPTPPIKPKSDFAGAFALAVLHPTTFEKRPVLEFDVLRPWTNTPEPEPLLERIRFVAELLEADERRFSDGLREMEQQRRQPKRRSLLSPASP